MANIFAMQTYRRSPMKIFCKKIEFYDEFLLKILVAKSCVKTYPRLPSFLWQPVRDFLHWNLRHLPLRSP